MNIPIHDFLIENTNKNAIKAYMPGHKGSLNPHDITEIDGADSLYENELTKGIIYQSEVNASKLFKSKRTLYSVQGSTLSIQTMLMLLKLRFPHKNRISAFRNAHRSFISAVVLLGFEVDWIYPDEFLSCKLTPQQVTQTITERTAGIFLNSSDYIGGFCDLESIRKAVGDLPILVDNAHSAHLVFEPQNHPNKFADLVCDSAHKTLPALTGGGYLHINNDEFLPLAKESMSIFGSSSPSYLILESLDLCNDFIENNAHKYRQTVKAIQNLRLDLAKTGFFSIAPCDNMKVVVKAFESGYKGVQIALMLQKLGVVCEYSDENYVVLLFSPLSSDEDFEGVLTAFRKTQILPKIAKTIYPVVKSDAQMSIREAFFAKSESVPIKKALDRISSGVFSPCPPGVPLVMPGERISAQMLDLLHLFGVKLIRIVI